MPRTVSPLDYPRKSPRNVMSVNTWAAMEEAKEEEKKTNITTTQWF